MLKLTPTEVSNGIQMSVSLRNPNDFGAIIRDRRKALKLDQAELARRVGVSRLWINQIERGKAGAGLGLTLTTLKALGINLAAETADDPTPPDAQIPLHNINAIVEAAKKPIRP